MYGGRENQRFWCVCVCVCVWEWIIVKERIAPEKCSKGPPFFFGNLGARYLYFYLWPFGFWHAQSVHPWIPSAHKVCASSSILMPLQFLTSNTHSNAFKNFDWTDSSGIGKKWMSSFQIDWLCVNRWRTIKLSTREAS